MKIGANWNESSKLTIRAEVFHKDHQNRFIGANDIVGTGSYGGLFVTGYTFTGIKLSVIYKPLPQLSFNTRYQPQSGEMSVTAGVANGGLAGEITSGKARGQQIGETVNWTPSGQIYLQGNINVVYNYLQTAYPKIVVESASTNIATPNSERQQQLCVVGSALWWASFSPSRLTHSWPGPGSGLTTIIRRSRLGGSPMGRASRSRAKTTQA